MWGVWVLWVRRSCQILPEGCDNSLCDFIHVTLSLTWSFSLVKSVLFQENSGSGQVGNSPQTKHKFWVQCSHLSDFGWISPCNLSLQIPLWHWLTFCWILPFSLTLGFSDCRVPGPFPLPRFPFPLLYHLKIHHFMAFSPLLFQFSPIIQGGVELELRENLLAELGGGGKIQPPLFSAWGRQNLLVWRGKLLGEKDLVIWWWWNGAGRILNHALSSLLTTRASGEGDKSNPDTAASSKDSQPSRDGVSVVLMVLYLYRMLIFISDLVWNWSAKQWGSNQKLLVVKSTVLEMSKSWQLCPFLLSRVPHTLNFTFFTPFQFLISITECFFTLLKTLY